MPMYYETEFYTIPYLYYSDKAMFFKTVLKNGESFFSNIFNQSFEEAYNNRRIIKKLCFSERDFKISDVKFKNRQRIIYISLPKPDRYSGESVYCVSYCIPYLLTEDSIKIMGLYNIEQSFSFESECQICMTKENGIHSNFGSVNADPEEILERVREIAFK